ncbi:MAG TPA: FtsX-like permease family protein [Puia sp.]
MQVAYFSGALVVLQFSLSIFLIIATVIVYQQVKYMLHKDLGMNISQVMVLERPGKWDTARSMHNAYVQRFRESLQHDPQIEAIGMSDELPGKAIRNPGWYQVSGTAPQASIPIGSITIDDQFLPMLGFHFLAGRNFSRGYKTDWNGLIITSSAVSLLGFKDSRDAIGHRLLSDGTTYPILGVVNDFHHLSLEQRAAPTVFQYNNSDAREFEYYLIKTKSANAVEVTRRIKASWDEAFRNNPFDPSFLDRDFNQQYESIIRFERLFAIFAMIAIIISCIGLFSLLAFVIQQRVKELGVRKVLGASMGDIVLLLSKDFLQLVLLANLVAWPLGGLLMNSWLKDFAYRIPIHLTVFLLSGATALLIAVLTIGVQSAQAASTNPIKSLRTE